MDEIELLLLSVYVVPGHLLVTDMIGLMQAANSKRWQVPERKNRGDHEELGLAWW